MKNNNDNIFDRFRNEALCRNESNQHKARIILKELYNMIEYEDYLELTIDLEHYNMGEFDANVFGKVINELKEKYEKY